MTIAAAAADTLAPRPTAPGPTAPGIVTDDMPLDPLPPRRWFGRVLRRGAGRVAHVPDGVRVYAVGDIHGRLDLLDALLARIRADDAARGPAHTQLILLGDLIDRGPDSAGVVARAMAGCDWARLAVLAGNHEQAMADALDGDRDMLRLWLDQGGDATLLSWGVDRATIDHGALADVIAAAHAAIPAAVRAWIAQRPTAITLGGYHFVHAGIRPGVPLARQRRRDALWIRDEFLGSRRDHGAVVVHGHTVSERVQLRRNRIGIDTGAVRHGRLTALGLEGVDRWLLSAAG